MLSRYAKYAPGTMYPGLGVNFHPATPWQGHYTQVRALYKPNSDLSPVRLKHSCQAHKRKRPPLQAAVLKTIERVIGFELTNSCLGKLPEGVGVPSIACDL